MHARSSFACSQLHLQHFFAWCFLRLLPYIARSRDSSVLALGHFPDLVLPDCPADNPDRKILVYSMLAGMPIAPESAREARQSVWQKAGLVLERLRELPQPNPPALHKKFSKAMALRKPIWSCLQEALNPRESRFHFSENRSGLFYGPASRFCFWG